MKQILLPNSLKKQQQLMFKSPILTVLKIPHTGHNR